ncbi:MAG: flagellar basal body P-ring formation protein FlgA [Pseudomonadales bacterium]|nr:flagellar basal body P-ring formation protein FlgA [Pseudomonadales bacterium]
MKTYPAQLLAAVLLVTTLGLPTSASANQTAKQIRAAVESYVNQRLQSMAEHPQFKNNSDIRIKIGRLDSRLKLALCTDDDLMIEDHSGSPLAGRYLLKASCTGDNIWSLFIPVTLTVIKPVVVAMHSVPRGALLQADQLQLVDWDVNRLKYGYFSSIKQVVNRQVRKPLRGGKPVLPEQLGITQVVRKGDEVLIEATKGQISVRSPGIALSDGGAGQQINVRNRRSKKVIRATVVAPGKVSVPM